MVMDVPRNALTSPSTPFNVSTVLSLWVANDIDVERLGVGILRKLLQAYSAEEYALFTFPFLIIPAWDVQVMVGPPAAVLDHEAILNMEASTKMV